MVEQNGPHKLKYRKKLNFVILFGAPGIYYENDPAHDKAWYSYVSLAMSLAKKGKLSENKNETVHWAIYAPAYQSRWANDNQEPSFWDKNIRDSDLQVTRYAHVQKVIKSGAKNYIDYIEKKVASYNLLFKKSNKVANYHKVITIKSALDFWITLSKLDDDTISRVWYFGHAAKDLWLSLYHPPPKYEASMLPSKAKKEKIKVVDIKNFSHLKSKFYKSKLSSKFYGCKTSAFAKEWTKIFKVPAEGAKGRINFNHSTLSALESSGKPWEKYNP